MSEDVRGIGAVVGTVRDARGLTQQKLAELSGVSTATISKLERDLHAPSRKVRLLIAAALGVDADRLSEWGEQVASADDPEEFLTRIPDELPDYQSQDVAQDVSEVLFSLSPVLSAERAALHVAADVGGAYENPRANGPSMLVGTADAERPWLVEPDAAGIDDGHLWLDPTAPIREVGPDADGLRVLRHDDGTYLVDNSDVERLRREGRLGHRDPERHRIRIALRRTPGELREIYFSTVLEFDIDGDVWIVEAATEGEEGDDSFPDGMASLTIVTAHNPRGRVLLRREADERNRLLRGDLETETGREVLEVDAHAPPDRTEWSEPSFGAIDLDRDRARGIARRYEQYAWFEWQAGRLRLHWTDDETGTDERPTVVR